MVAWRASMWGVLVSLVVGFSIVLVLWWRANSGGTTGSLDVNAKQLAERRKHWGPQ
jgi:hypothetical protein